MWGVRSVRRCIAIVLLLSMESDHGCNNRRGERLSHRYGARNAGHGLCWECGFRACLGSRGTGCQC